MNETISMHNFLDEVRVAMDNSQRQRRPILSTKLQITNGEFKRR